MIRLFLLLSICITGSTVAAQNVHQRYPLIPWPDSLREIPGAVRLERTAELVVAHDSILQEAVVFNEFLLANYGFTFETSVGKRAGDGNIFLTVDPAVAGTNDAYQLSVNKRGVSIRGKNLSGVFYGLQTLLQLIPPSKSAPLDIQCVEIVDQPRFSYRGMHLDVSRHFFPVVFVKRYIDHLARYKMNYFHWHLTDDQGWRIEIKRYPDLQRKSAWRNGTRIGHYSAVPEAYDTIRYGGYYTQDEVREVVAYASRRHITVLPEIEMPGHALAVLAAYPELSCTGGPFEVGRTWGVFQDVFCPKEETFQFLENVLTEVCELFPGTYIHIGGDECPKDRWKACQNCQSLMKREGLKDEHELQSYFIHRIERFLNSKNKRIIGWDEILEGGLAPDATVMSWRGYQGGIDAAKMGHDVVMTPTSYCYFDYYQSRNPQEPLAIGGFLPLDKVYRFEPVPDALTGEDAKHILGVQANLWTEYIPDEKQVEYMLTPRVCALAEVAWTTSSKKNYDNFVERLGAHFKQLKFLNVNYSPAVFDVEAAVYPGATKGIDVVLSSPYKYGTIRYTTNGSQPDGNSKIYTAPLNMDQSTIITSALYDGTDKKGNVLKQIFRVNQATGKTITLVNKPHEEYCRGGGFTLINGVYGALPWNGADWLGFSGQNLDATVDLGQSITIIRAGIDVLNDEGSWIHYPKSIEVLLSDDGVTFTSFGKLEGDKLDKSKRYVLFPVDKVKARYVKFIAENAGIIPEGKPGAGNPSWLFVDELVVE